MYFGRVETDKIAKNKVGPMPWDTLYIFINLSPRNGKSQGPDDQIEHELREVFACLTGSRSASADITSPAETRRQGGTINYEDRCP